MAENHKITLAGLPLRVAPSEVRWNFTMKTADMAAVGGKVIQIVGLTTSDITVRGHFSPDRRYGDRDAFDQAERFRGYIKGLAKATAETTNPTPVRFTYPPRGWDFDVFIKKISPVVTTVDSVAPEWDLVLFPVEEGVREVVKGIKDLYIQRLMDGIGWKQTGYNGPMTQELAEQEMGGLSPEEYQRSLAAEAIGGQEGSLW